MRALAPSICMRTSGLMKLSVLMKRIVELL